MIPNADRFSFGKVGHLQISLSDKYISALFFIVADFFSVVNINKTLLVLT